MNLFLNLLFEECPNCASAWTGGNTNPEDRTFCVVCSDKQGRITGRVFRILWLQRLIVKRNFKRALSPINNFIREQVKW